MAESQNARPVHSQGLLLIVVAVGVLLMAVYLTSSIIENENGGISAAVRTIGIGLAIWSLVRPKAGLYIMSIEAFSLDYVKKIAVYYGATSMGTIIEVLVVGMLAVAGTIGGFLLQTIALRRYKLPPLLWGVFGVATLATVALFLTQYRANGLEKSAENAVNCCVYIAIALPVAMVLVDREQLTRLLNVQFFCCTAWAVWGIKQYYFGFTWLEWFYAETGLSAVATDHMIRVNDTRPFGFGSGMPNYGVLAPYVCYGVWQFLHDHRRRFLFGVCTLIIGWGVITSLQRILLVTPAFVILFCYCFQTMRRSVIVYFLSFAVFVVGITFAEQLLNSLGDINSAISVQGYWGENMLSVNTYADRLNSWTTLKNLDNYTLFGAEDKGFTHDVFSAILMAYGTVGLLGTLTIMTYGAWFVLRTVLRIENPEDKALAIFCLAVVAAMTGLGFVSGGNFTANPINVSLWSFFSVSVSLVVNSRLVPANAVKPSIQELLKGLESAQAKVPMAARAALQQAKA